MSPNHSKRIILFCNILLMVAGLIGLTACGRRISILPTPSATPTRPGDPIISSGTEQVFLNAPTTLQIRDSIFKVKAVEIQKNVWRYQRGSADSAQWVYGTLVNYVIGLEATTANTDLVQALDETDFIQVSLANGRVLKFQFSGRQWIEQDAAADLFQQLRPGLTLALLGDKGTKRLVVTASYVSSVEPTPAAGSELVELGTWIQVGEARVIALNGQLVREAADLTAGHAYYVVDFSVEALGPNTLDAGMFQMDLIDGQGRRYALSVPASLAGAYGPAGGQLEPGQVLTATAGYLVPDTISGPTVEWAFSPRPGSRAPARIQLALAGAVPMPTPDPSSSVAIQVNTVAYGPGMTEIVINGGIGNPTDHVVTVNREDVLLQSGTASVSLIEANPGFPWSISPGESRAFALRFARPSPGTAVLQILHWSFELGGLQ